MDKTQRFIDKAIGKHGDKYDYSLVEYKNSTTKVKIICPIHGEFIQLPYSHTGGSGCRKCTDFDTAETFIKKAVNKHGDRYDYSKVNYVRSKQKVIIICPIHGDFEQEPRTHLTSNGCPKCYHDSMKIPIEQFILQCRQIHGDRYDYSKVNYAKIKDSIIIICPIHGEFRQRGDAHLGGSGCKLCNISKGERRIERILIENDIPYIREKSFNGLVGDKGWKLRFDFYLPTFNLCIEYDGVQHFKPVERFGGKDTLNRLMDNDNRKNIYCKENNINLLRIPYTEYDNIDIKIMEGIET